MTGSRTFAMTTILLLSAASCLDEAPAPCDPPLADLVAVEVNLADVPADSVISALIQWTANGPPDPRAWLEARGATGIHVFHYQPWTYFSVNAATMREIATIPDVILQVALGPLVSGGVCSSASSSSGGRSWRLQSAD